MAQSPWLAATHRFRDSGHAIGLLGPGGGKVRHPVLLEPGRAQYVLIVTGTVLPPYRGDARVVVEGEPEMDYDIHCPAPVIDLGIHRVPTFRTHVLEGLQPKDKFTLWVVMRPHGPHVFSAGNSHAAGNTVAFYDTQTGRRLLEVPVIYQVERETSHGRNR
jgi:hypothetical protein